jgi:histidinol-phosphatase
VKCSATSEGAENDLELAGRLADAASAVALGFHRARKGARLKADGTPVCDADLEAERAMRGLLAVERPADTVLGEELGTSGPASSRRWLLDPIDGTESFISGGSAWGTHVTLEVNGDPVVAVITRPTRSARWWAVRGRGAWGASQASSECDALTVADDGPATKRVAGLVDAGSPRASMLADRMRWVDDEVSPIVALLEGRVGAVLDEGGEPWDRAPAILLALEAGASCRGPSGPASAGDSWVLYAVPSIVDGLAAVLEAGGD